MMSIWASFLRLIYQVPKSFSTPSSLCIHLVHLQLHSSLSPNKTNHARAISPNGIEAHAFAKYPYPATWAITTESDIWHEFQLTFPWTECHFVSPNRVLLGSDLLTRKMSFLAACPLWLFSVSIFVLFVIFVMHRDSLLENFLRQCQVLARSYIRFDWLHFLSLESHVCLLCFFDLMNVALV